MRDSDLTLVWQRNDIRAFAHEVATAASELREVAPLLRALGELRVPVGRAAALQRDLAALHKLATKLHAAMERDATDLWAAVGASTQMEQAVTTILTQRPHPAKPA